MGNPEWSKQDDKLDFYYVFQGKRQKTRHGGREGRSPEEIVNTTETKRVFHVGKWPSEYGLLANLFTEQESAKAQWANVEVSSQCHMSVICSRLEIYTENVAILSRKILTELHPNTVINNNLYFYVHVALSVVNVFGFWLMISYILAFVQELEKKKMILNKRRTELVSFGW